MFDAKELIQNSIPVLTKNRGHDTEPCILMDSIRSPNKVQGLFLSPPGVHQNPYYSRTPDPVLPNPSRTPPIVQMDSTKANLILRWCKKTFDFSRIQTLDLLG